MNAHEFLDDDLREQAALYVLGSLGEDEARRWRLHLAQCAACRGEVAELERIAAELVGIAPQVEPPPQLWPRVLERVRRIAREDAESAVEPKPALNRAAGNEAAVVGQVWKYWSPDPAEQLPFTYVDEDLGAFQPTAFPGISARRLFVDRDRDRVTMLVRMEPGSAYPSHRHAGPEDCYVLQGDLNVTGREMRAGDFVRSSPGSVHGVQSTRGGCVLFLVSSLNDELLG